MLGEMIVDGQGNLTTQRVLPSDGPLPKLEVTFEILGTVLGKTAKTFVTYWSAVQPDGSLYGECTSQGVVMTENGESATFRAAGTGNFTGPGGAVALVAGGLERAARQHRPVGDLGPGGFRQRGHLRVREIGRGASHVEVEFHRCRHATVSLATGRPRVAVTGYRRRSGSRSSASVRAGRAAA